MARTIAEIQNQIISAIQADSTLSGASSPSATAIWRLFAFVMASAIWALEVIFDAFKVDLLAQVEALKPHTLKWYQAKALAFQYGSDLPTDSDEYDNTALTDAEVAEQKIIVQAAAVEENGSVKIKVCKLNNSNNRVALDSTQLASFTSYVGEIKDAGVDIVIINQDGDKMTLTADIYYDPLVLTSTGARIDGTDNEPIQTAVKTHLANLSFNSLLVKSRLVDVLQAVDGVYVPEIRSLACGKFDASALGAVDIQYLPFAGYFDDTELTFNLTFKSKDTL